MAIELIKGNLLDSNAKYIAHQCNALSRQSAGLAYTLFNKFPHADIYKDRGMTGRIFPSVGLEAHTAGNILIKGDGKEKRFVINMIGQVFPGSPLYPNALRDGYAVREKYFRTCLVKIGTIRDLESIAFPWMVGCGLAGGEWKDYYTMLEIFDSEINKRQKVKVSLYKHNDS